MALPPGFVWPPWCLSQKDPQIEVLVVDGERTAWVAGHPRTRVVNPQGQDAWLAVEYPWDGTSYDEDFGPDRVRRRGETVTVLEQAKQGLLGPSESPARAGDPAELILECVDAAGVNLGTVTTLHRALAFGAEPGSGSIRATVGRLQQQEFFQRLLPRPELFTSISRAHLELAWDPSTAKLTLRKLTQMEVLVDGSPVRASEVAVLLSDGACIGFISPAHTSGPFMSLRLCLRSQTLVDSEGPHPALAETLRQQQAAALPPPANAPVPAARPAPDGNSQPAAMLECTLALGTDVSRLPRDVAMIPLPMNASVEVGRQHQRAMFDQLLQAQPSWLAFISRSHLQLRLARHEDSGTAGAITRFFVDNSELKSEAAGLGFHLSTTGQDRDGVNHQPWGTTVEGVRIDAEWVRVGERFLQVSIRGVQVLRALEEPPAVAGPSLSVENLSANVVLVAGAPLAKGQSAHLRFGGTISFVAAPEGAGETRFLEFMCRPA